MNDDRPNASIFVRATLMPTALAARSLDRTAMNMRPAGALRNRATSSPTRHTMSSTTTPKITRGYVLPLAIPSPTRRGAATACPCRAGRR